MNALTKADIQKIAELSKLHIPENNISSMTQELEKILKLVDKMNQIDTEQTPPLAHPFDATQPLRSDNITEHNQRDLLQRDAPQVEAGLYLVPKFVDSE